MNPLDRSLQRLFNAAARAPGETPGPPPFAIESVLARWKSAGTPDEFALARLFRQAMICAGLIMLLSAGWSWSQSRAADETDLANYTMTLQLPP